MITNSLGRDIDIFNLQSDDIDIRDIAHALSLKCRFNSCCKRFYSVAEHCIRAAYMSSDPLESMYLLLHDAAEAYIPDFPGPDKKYYHIYTPPCNLPVTDLEESILNLILITFGLNPFSYLRHKIRIHKIDLRLGATEARDLMPKQVYDAEPYLFTIVPLRPEQAEKSFITLFNSLQRAIKNFHPESPVP